MRLIDADALTKNWERDKGRMFDADYFIFTIEHTPTIDAVPVRHGRWVEYGENKDGTHNIHCSVCDAGFKSKGHANSYYTKRKYRYCPSCGTKMDEEKDNG